MVVFDDHYVQTTQRRGGVIRPLFSQQRGIEKRQLLCMVMPSFLRFLSTLGLRLVSSVQGWQAGRREEWEIHFYVYVYIELYFSSLFNASSSATF